MNIGGFLKQSFIDYPAMISAVIFTNGCNLSCWYCHNKQLISGTQKQVINFAEILEFLESRKSFLDAVVITGGEPTLQSDLEDVINEIKRRGFKVKLDTNGTRPDVLARVLDKVDYVAMDIKNSFANMSKTICNSNPQLIENIRKSIAILKSGNTEYEFRTTFTPDISLEDIEEIGKTVDGAKAFYLQTYIPQAGSKGDKHSKSEYEEALDKLRHYVKKSFLR